jgi:hypothetical protein
MFPGIEDVPGGVDGFALAVDGVLSRSVNTVERSIRALNGPNAENLADTARFLLRSEAVASSRVEGIAPSAQQVALAELGQSEAVRGVPVVTTTGWGPEGPSGFRREPAVFARRASGPGSGIPRYMTEIPIKPVRNILRVHALSACGAPT